MPQRSQTRSAARHHHARREWDDRSLARQCARSSRRRKTLFEFWEEKEVECSCDSSFLLGTSTSLVHTCEIGRQLVVRPGMIETREGNGHRNLPKDRDAIQNYRLSAILV